MDPATIIRKQRYVTQIYATLALLSLSIFGCLHLLVEKNTQIGLAELAGATAVALNIFLLKATDNIATARACLLLTILTLLFVMLATGGTAGTGIFWFFMFPVAAFFLAGVREGSYWMLLLFAVLAIAWISGQAGLPFYYQDIEIRQLAVTLGVVTVGIAAYQRYREMSEGEASGFRQELHANIQQSAALHVKMDQAKSDFVTLASHQLRTPISAIKWSSEMLLNNDAGKLNAEQRETIGGIESSNQRLAAIVDTMLLVSSLDLGKMTVHVEMVNLPALSKKVLAEQARKMPEKQLTIEESYRADVPRLRLDNRIMIVILQNIFSNAIKYTPPNGGKVLVTIRRHDERLYQGSRGSVLIEVADNGYGIPKGQQKDVFAKMFRASNAKAKDTDGTGLGLYAVKALLELAGGKIWFESEENKGTTFFVLLPLEGMERREAAR